MGKKKHIVNLMFTITLLGVFALAALFVSVMGAQVYAHNAEKMQTNFDVRTSVIYMAEKIRQTPNSNFGREEINGTDALVLKENVDGNSYETWIYVYDGDLYEVMVDSGTEVIPENNLSRDLMPLKSLTIEENNNVFKLTIENSLGETESLSIGRKENSYESV